MSTSPVNVQNVFSGYAPSEAGFDEFLDGAQQPRAACRQFVDLLNQMGVAELNRRWDQVQRLVHENGIAYGGYSTPKDKPRPWELDAIPLIISASEWQAVAEGLQQRAQVLELTLRDLFGEQKLLARGILPPELVFAHPAFRRPYHGLIPPDHCYLHFYAADLVRSPEGCWHVTGDRTEAPSGLGYALENRIVISRMLPDVFHNCQVQRLAPFFIAAREMFRSLAPQHRENPRVVLLSHGPNSPNYFEDAYLARYLGYTLVEGGDLAVRNEQVMLKTLGGLLPVDVIWRRQNSHACDPLELDANSRIGVAGLMQVARSGRVAIVNSLGSGLVESAAFSAFLPQLCRELTGEDLLLPTVQSWWCGDPQSCQHVLANLDNMILQPAFRRRGQDGRLAAELNEMPRDQRAAILKANPSRYSARQRVARSTAPVWETNLQPAHVALRAYAVSSGRSYMVMHGALARTSKALAPLELSIQRGEGSKDAWVLADGPVEPVSLLTEPGAAVELRRIGTELPSRTADNFFWLGRQLERAEAAARMLRSTAGRMTGETPSIDLTEVPVLLRCLADQGQIEPGYVVAEMRGQLPAIENELARAVFDTSHSGCMRSLIDELLRLASLVRDRVSEDTWRVFHRIDEAFQPTRYGTTSLSEVLAMTDELMVELAAISGIVRESMTRTLAYRFLELGRRLERSQQIINLTGSCFIPLTTPLSPVIEAALEVSDSLMTYRSRYMANLQLAAVLDLLLTDETNPRSLAYQFVQLADLVEQLPRQQSQPGYSSEQRIARSLLHSIQMVDISAVAEAHSLDDSKQLRRLMENWEGLLPRLAEAISHRYFVHAGPAHQLAEIVPQ